MQYIGKGNYYRALDSAKRISNENADRYDVDNIQWEKAATTREAFKMEAMKMKTAGFGKTIHELYNKMWSPGKNYSIQDGDTDEGYWK
jgi:hypothetical protein